MKNKKYKGIDFSHIVNEREKNDLTNNIILNIESLILLSEEKKTQVAETAFISQLIPLLLERNKTYALNLKTSDRALARELFNSLPKNKQPEAFVYFLQYTVKHPNDAKEMCQKLAKLENVEPGLLFFSQYIGGMIKKENIVDQFKKLSSEAKANVFYCLISKAVLDKKDIPKETQQWFLKLENNQKSDVWFFLSVKFNTLLKEKKLDPNEAWARVTSFIDLNSQELSGEFKEVVLVWKLDVAREIDACAWGADWIAGNFYDVSGKKFKIDIQHIEQYVNEKYKSDINAKKLFWEQLQKEIDHLVNNTNFKHEGIEKIIENLQKEIKIAEVKIEELKKNVDKEENLKKEEEKNKKKLEKKDKQENVKAEQLKKDTKELEGELENALNSSERVDDEKIKKLASKVQVISKKIKGYTSAGLESIDIRRNLSDFTSVVPDIDKEILKQWNEKLEEKEELQKSINEFVKQDISEKSIKQAKELQKKIDVWTFGTLNDEDFQESVKNIKKQYQGTIKDNVIELQEKLKGVLNNGQSEPVLLLHGDIQGIKKIIADWNQENPDEEMVFNDFDDLCEQWNKKHDEEKQNLEKEIKLVQDKLLKQTSITNEEIEKLSNDVSVVSQKVVNWNEGKGLVVGAVEGIAQKNKEQWEKSCKEKEVLQKEINEYTKKEIDFPNVKSLSDEGKKLKELINKWTFGTLDVEEFNKKDQEVTSKVKEIMGKQKALEEQVKNIQKGNITYLELKCINNFREEINTYNKNHIGYEVNTSSIKSNDELCLLCIKYLQAQRMQLVLQKLGLEATTLNLDTINEKINNIDQQLTAIFQDKDYSQDLKNFCGVLQELNQEVINPIVKLSLENQISKGTANAKSAFKTFFENVCVPVDADLRKVDINTTMKKTVQKGLATLLANKSVISLEWHWKLVDFVRSWLFGTVAEDDNTQNQENKETDKEKKQTTSSSWGLFSFFVPEHHHLKKRMDSTAKQKLVKTQEQVNNLFEKKISMRNC